MKLRAILASSWVRALIPLLLVVALGCIFNKDGAFFEWSTHRAMLREISVVGILACGMTLVIVAGGIDLSVGSVLALSAVCFATFLMQKGWSAPVAIALSLGVGLTMGGVSGAISARFRVQPFVVTLAVMVFARGLAKLISEGKKVTNYVTLADGSTTTVALPPVFQAIDAKVLGGNVSVVTLVFAGSAALTWLVLSRMRLGRYLFAAGGNYEAARLSGVPLVRSLIAAYALCGLFAALGGICQAAQETQGDPETGLGYELDAIAMVVLGGTSLSGGKGGVGLTLIGALTLGYLQKILSLNAFSIEARLMLTGVILIGAVLFQRRLGRDSEG